MNREALFCDGTERYVSPEEPKAGEKVRVRFRTAREDVDIVYCIANGEKLSMEKERMAEDTLLFDYYAADISLTDDPCFYYFEVVGAGADDACIYHSPGILAAGEAICPFRLLPGFSVPDWAKGALLYQIFVDRFCNGDPENDVVDWEYIYLGRPCRKAEDWDQCPDEYDTARFYGGDLQGVLDKLDYLQELGVEAVYFNPLFVSPSSHKYDTQDYDYIDPHFGKLRCDGGQPLSEEATDNQQAELYRIRTGNLQNLEEGNALFAKLTEEMHRRGMKVILDGVFNHCGSFHKWLDREGLYERLPGYEKGAYVSKASPYRNFFRFSKSGKYEGWWGYDTLPKLDYEQSPKLEQTMFAIARKWLQPPYNIDGWRLDVAADLGHSESYNHVFWKRFRQEVKGVNPNALIVAEHYGDPTAWLLGDQWDTVMNYDAFMEPVSWFLTGMEKHSDGYCPEKRGNGKLFADTMRYAMAKLPTGALYSAMNQLSNHDHSRFLTRTNHQVGRVDALGSQAAGEGISEAVMRQAVVLQMTWVGAPTVYYGDEAGVVGFTDPDSRRTYPWGGENQALLAFHKAVIGIRKKRPVLRRGSLKIFHTLPGLLAYARFDGHDRVVVVINCSREVKKIRIPVWLAEISPGVILEQLLYSCEGGFTTEKKAYRTEGTELTVTIDADSALILGAGEVKSETGR